MADIPWDQDVSTDDVTPPSEWNDFKDRVISIAGDKSIGDGFTLLKADTKANRPSAGYAGRMFYATDEGIWYRDDGSSWVELVRAEGQIRLNSLAEKDYSSLDAVPSTFTPEAHSLAGGSHNSDTLSDLNSKIDDATLDDQGSTRFPEVHGDTEHDSTVATDGDAQPPETHNLAGSAHGSDSLADLNSKISDATLDDQGSARTPETHGDGKHDSTVDSSAVSAVESSTLSMAGNVNPDSDNARQLGQSGTRWSAVYAVDVYGTVHYGDLAFTEKRCEICGEKFEEGDKVSLIVNEVKEDGTYLVPKHEGC